MYGVHVRSWPPPWITIQQPPCYFGRTTYLLQPNPPSQHLQQVGLSQRLWRHSQLNRQQSGGLLSAVGRLISSGSGDLVTIEKSLENVTLFSILIEVSPPLEISQSSTLRRASKNWPSSLFQSRHLYLATEKILPMEQLPIAMSLCIIVPLITRTYKPHSYL